MTFFAGQDYSFTERNRFHGLAAGRRHRRLLAACLVLAIGLTLPLSLDADAQPQAPQHAPAWVLREMAGLNGPNAAKLDIDLVRLYMTSDDVVRALRAKYGRNASISIKPGVNGYDNSQNVQELAFIGTKGRMMVLFTDGVPGSGKRELAYAIDYSADNINSLQSEQKMTSAILAKYGKPNIGVLDAQSAKASVAKWCDASAVTNPPVAFGPPQTDCDENKPYMKFDGTKGLSLDDFGLEKKLRQKFQSIQTKPDL